MHDPDGFFCKVSQWRMYRELLMETTKKIDKVPWFDVHNYTVESNNAIFYHTQLKALEWELWYGWRFFMCTCKDHAEQVESKKTR